MGITSSYASGSIHHKSLNKLFYAPMRSAIQPFLQACLVLMMPHFQQPLQLDAPYVLLTLNHQARG